MRAVAALRHASCSCCPLVPTELTRIQDEYPDRLPQGSFGTSSAPAAQTICCSNPNRGPRAIETPFERNFGFRAAAVPHSGWCSVSDQVWTLQLSPPGWILWTFGRLHEDPEPLCGAGWLPGRC